METKEQKLQTLSSLLKKSKSSTASSTVRSAANGVTLPDDAEYIKNNNGNTKDVEAMDAVKTALVGFGVLAPTSAQQQV